MTVVNYEGKNIQTFRGKGDFKLRFIPGPNEVPEEDWKKIQAESQGIGQFVDGGKLRVLRQLPRAPSKAGGAQAQAAKVPVKDLSEVDVGLMTGWDAVTLVEGTIDSAALMEYQKQERARTGGQRKLVVDAIAKQITAVSEPGEGSSSALADLTTLNVKKASAVISGVTDLAVLDEYAVQEQGRGKGPRASVVKALDEKRAGLTQ